jgi:RNA recognition motif-containing protein
MSGDLYVGNLPHSATEMQIKEHFTPVGQVISVNIMTDRKGRSRCFGFVQVENPEEAAQELNEKEFQGRKLRVSRAIPETPYRPAFQRGGRRGGGDRGGRY